MQDKSALHLPANQTIKTDRSQSLFDFYAQQLISKKSRDRKKIYDGKIALRYAKSERYSPVRK